VRRADADQHRTWQCREAWGESGVELLVGAGEVLIAVEGTFTWSNSLRRDLEAIGIARPPQLPRLGDYLKAIENTPAAAPEEDAAPEKDADA
jgi:hypothetical protein